MNISIQEHNKKKNIRKIISRKGKDIFMQCIVNVVRAVCTIIAINYSFISREEYSAEEWILWYD